MAVSRYRMMMSFATSSARLPQGDESSTSKATTTTTTTHPRINNLSNVGPSCGMLNQQSHFWRRLLPFLFYSFPTNQQHQHQHQHQHHHYHHQPFLSFRHVPIDIDNNGTTKNKRASFSLLLFPFLNTFPLSLSLFLSFTSKTSTENMNDWKRQKERENYIWKEKRRADDWMVCETKPPETDQTPTLSYLTLSYPSSSSCVLKIK